MKKPEFEAMEPSITANFHGPNYGGAQVAANFGTIQITKKRGQGPTPKPTTTIPYNKDLHFVGRKDILEEIELALQPGQQQEHCRVALVGEPGVGKTQIAVEYALNLRKASPDTWVFWVNAASKFTFEDSYRKIAMVADIYGTDELNADILFLVDDWLKKESSGNWLIIIDNNDDDALLTEEIDSGRVGVKIRLEDYIPATPNSAILLTTRNTHAAMNFCSQTPPIEIPRLNPTEAHALFTARLPPNPASSKDKDKDDHEAISSLLSYLEYLPIALTQASAYIHQHSCTPQYYLTLLQKSDTEAMGLLDTALGVPRSVLKTWSISFEYIKRKNEFAARLLSMMCFLQRNGISEALLSDEKERESHVFTTAIGILVAFNFVSVSQDRNGNVYEMHRLVQLSTKAWIKEVNTDLKKTDETGIYASMALNAVANAFPDFDFEDEVWCRQLLLHVKTLLAGEYKFEKLEEKKVKAKLMHHASMYESDLGNYNVVEGWMVEVVQLRKEVLGVKTIDTVYSMNNLALAYYDTGKSKEAVVLQGEVLKGFQKLKGSKDPETLSAMGYLANFYLDVGEWGRAEKLAKKAIKLSQHLKDEGIDSVLRRKMILLSIYNGSAQYDLAEKLALQLLQDVALLETKNATDLETGVDNDDDLADTVQPETKWSIERTLAMIYRSQGKLEQAEKLLASVINAMAEDEFPNAPKAPLAPIDPSPLPAAEHPSTEKSTEITTKSKAKSKTITKSKAKAQPATTPTAIKTLPPPIKLPEATPPYTPTPLHPSLLSPKTPHIHPSTLQHLSDLTLIYEDLGLYEPALSISQHTLTHQTSLLGPLHPDRLSNLSNQISLHERLGLLLPAHRIALTVITHSTTLLGPHHRHTLLSLGTLCSVLRARGMLAESLKLGRYVLDTRIKVLGQNHPDVWVAVVSLGETMGRVGRGRDVGALVGGLGGGGGGGGSWGRGILSAVFCCVVLMLGIGVIVYKIVDGEDFLGIWTILAGAGFGAV